MHSPKQLINRNKSGRLVGFTRKEVRYLSDRGAFRREEAIEYLVGNSLVSGFLRIFITTCRQANEYDDPNAFRSFEPKGSATHLSTYR